MMQIGAASAASGVSAKMIRHYETIGLIEAADRSAGNYRTYGTDDVHRLRFIRRARDLGFSIPRIRMLLALWSDQARTSGEVKYIAMGHLADLERRIAEMREMAAVLHRLVDACGGDARPHCPIIDDLAGDRASGHPPNEDARRTLE